MCNYQVREKDQTSNSNVACENESRTKCTLTVIDIGTYMLQCIDENRQPIEHKQLKITSKNYNRKWRKVDIPFHFFRSFKNESGAYPVIPIFFKCNVFLLLEK